MATWSRVGAGLAAMSLAANAPAPPPAPDYGKPGSWAATDANEGLAARVAPRSKARSSRLDADVFYIYPTTDRSTSRWNTPVEDQAINAWTDGSVVARQASVFNACCRVFVPRYRQATAGTGKAGPAVREMAMALAYEDVRRAFGYYLKHDNRGRPFILVGHSQGAAHLQRLLTEEVDGKPLAGQLIAAYVVGIAYPVSAVAGPRSTLTVCSRPDSVQCVVHWSSVLTSADIGRVRNISESYNRAQLPAGQSPEVLCVNPLTFDLSRPVASANRAKGAVPGAPDAGALRAIVPKAIAARCERGVLVVEPSSSLDLQPQAGGSMHYHDLGMFYEDVRENALSRVKAWHAAHLKPQ